MAFNKFFQRNENEYTVQKRSSSFIYSSSNYSTSDQNQQSQVQNQQTISNLIPLNIAIYNPALSCNYSHKFTLTYANTIKDHIWSSI